MNCIFLFLSLLLVLNAQGENELNDSYAKNKRTKIIQKINNIIENNQIVVLSSYYSIGFFKVILSLLQTSQNLISRQKLPLLLSRA